ncbi:MAG: Tetratricopeptide repeat protein [Planctomycetaceae bacterium]|nr:Tetratricopeptide repeat protein [Planctomycetaceae bacterium]
MTSATSASSEIPQEPSRLTSVPTDSRSQRFRYRLIAAVSLVLLAGVVAGGWYLYRASALRAIPSQIMAAERLLGAGKFVEARKKLKPVFWWRPRQMEARSIQGRCLLGEDNVDDAAPILLSIPEDSPVHKKGAQALIMAYLQRGEVDHAETAMRRFLDRYPVEDTIRYELRWLYYNQFRTRDVVALLEEKLQLAEAGTTTLPTLADLLDCEYRQLVPFEGVKYLEVINTTLPRQGLINLALGYAHWQMGDALRARGPFHLALAVLPDHPHVRCVVSAFLIEQGQFENAKAVLTRLPIPETDDRYWALQSQLAEHAKDVSLALKYLDRAIELRGQDLRCAARRVNLLRELGRDKTEVAQAVKLAHELLKADRELADLVAAGAHHQATRADAERIATLCEQLGKRVQAKYWRLIRESLPANREPAR